MTAYYIPDSRENTSQSLHFDLHISGASPSEFIDVEVAGLNPENGGVCPKFAPISGCYLMSGTGETADESGRATVDVEFYRCAALSIATQDADSVGGVYTTWIKDRITYEVVTATFSVVNSAATQPVSTWGCT